MRYTIEYNNHTSKDFYEVWLIENDYLKSSTISSIKQVESWDKKNNDIHIFIRDNKFNRIVGEITLLPLNKIQFDKFMKNEIEDTEINSDSLLKYKKDMECYLLFSAIAIDKSYRKDRKVLSLLLEGLYNKIKKLQSLDIILLNMCSEGQTKEGQDFIENFLNLKEKYITNNNFKLYSFDNKNNFDQWLKKFPIYIKNYNNKYEIN